MLAIRLVIADAATCYSPLLTILLRASTIELSQRAIRNKLVYFCLVEGKRRGERR